MSSSIPLRVTLLDTWEEHDLELPSETLITEVKRVALARSRIRRSPTEYEVKYNGARMIEDQRTLADAGVAPNSALIVLSTRRRPAK